MSGVLLMVIGSGYFFNAQKLLDWRQRYANSMGMKLPAKQVTADFVRAIAAVNIAAGGVGFLLGLGHLVGLY